MEAPCITPENPIRSIEINNEGKKYYCTIEMIDELIEANIFLDKKLKFKGNIFLEKIQSQIKTFLDYNIYEIFEEINQLNSNRFLLIKENNKYKLKIEFTILRKKRSIVINLNENKNKLNDNKMNDTINNYEKLLKEKDNIILELKEKIKKLEEKLNEEKEKKDENDNLYINFNINSKNLFKKLNFHEDSVNCLTKLNDGRFASGSDDNKIIIYNKITYQPDLIINEHKNYVLCLTQLSSGILASGSWDNKIKLLKIKEKNYEVMQTLNYHTDCVYKIIELKNKNLISCSSDKSIIIYLKNNYNYQKDFKISTKGSIYSVAQTKENEICFLEHDNNHDFNVSFFNLNERKIEKSITNINSCGGLGLFTLITKDLLIVGGEAIISIINVYQYKVVRIIDVPNSNWIYGFCRLNKNMFLTGDGKGIINQWKIEGDNLNLVSKKENAHENSICALIELEGERIISASSDETIKIW